MKNNKLSLPNLPYKYNALEPFISEEIMRLHHDIHHKGYVDKANLYMDKIDGYKIGDEADIKSFLKNLSFNYNGAKLHEVFWQNMTDNYKDPSPDMKSMFQKEFGSLDRFKEIFSKTALMVEGSGWAVLGVDSQKKGLVYQIEKHNNGHLAGFSPILVLDVWEHAYYLDYKNKRDEYIENWWKVVNWEYVYRAFV